MTSGKEIRIISLLALDTVFFFLEIIIGYAVNSLALIADSFHMLNDIISLIVALWAVGVAKNRQADSMYTYGWKRAEILGALINAVFLLALCFSIFVESIQRFIQPQEITNPKLILIVGCSGLLSNFVGLLLFHEHGGHSHSHGDFEAGSMEANAHQHSHGDLDGFHFGGSGSGGGNHDVDGDTTEEESQLEPGSDIDSVLPATVVNKMVNEEIDEELDTDHHKHHSSSSKSKKSQSGKSLNMQGVFLHVLGDALGNVGVIATALFIWKTDFTWRFYFDPAVSLLITGIIFSSALPLCRSSSKILLQATPTAVSYDNVREDLLKIPRVMSIHDFHIWNLTEKVFIASLHVEIDGNPDEFLKVATSIKQCLHNSGIHSVTIQPEFTEFYRHRSTVSLVDENNDTKNQNNNNYSTNVNSNGNNTTIGSSLMGYGAAGNSTEDATECIVDETIGCNTDNCLDVK
ncbi:hypothetical protein PACTADRAFT_184958 [Pachysolen tannophilus NRRL Y-2460]|uniref:Uncharacterized protein n=1 Tax=Pachysolen tannophilus NRRL Y-2460 TaxID=669874 RepID=A0A1E4U3B4_PACTA|nr:hypothetical protein PACTADRAFT_184958 [Pachysolen tannophilus NRRL Y-2460]